MCEYMVSASSTDVSRSSQESPGSSIRGLLVTSSLWTILGYGFAQSIRLGNNLILTRLVSREVFGLMALVQAIITGLSFITDIGIGPSVIQSKDGDDPRFLRTAWSIQILRSVLIWIACCLLAWPAAAFYREPDMIVLVPVAGIATLISGFVSINLFLMNKQLRLGPQTLMDLGSQILSVIVMIGLAYATHSVWALLIGTIVGAVARATMSHWVLPGPSVSFGIDRDIASKMFRFSRWITISTIITFILSQGDRLVLGRYMVEKADLGVYATGYLIPQTATMLVGTLANRVLFPLYSRLVAHGDGTFHTRVRSISCAVCATTLPVLWILMLFAQHVIDFLYPAAYHDAGWILRVFTITATVDTITSSVGPVLLAYGNSLAVLKINIGRVIGLVVLCITCGLYGGVPSLIVAFAAVPLVTYPVIAWFAWQTGIWFPLLDLGAIGLSVIVLALGWHCGL